MKRKEKGKEMKEDEEERSEEGRAIEAVPSILPRPQGTGFVFNIFPR